MKIAICIPCTDVVYMDFMMSLLALQDALNRNPVHKNQNINIFIHRSSLLIGSRTDLAKDALDWGADWILWLDSDMVFPADLLHRLMKTKRSVVAANYVKRSMPTTPVTTDADRHYIRTDPESTGLQEADTTGFGALLVKADIFRKVPLPWFDLVWLEDGTLLGEDVFFFKKIKHYLNATLWIDHDTSQLVRHIGTFEYHNRLAVASIQETEKQNNVNDSSSSLQ